MEPQISQAQYAEAREALKDRPELLEIFDNQKLSPHQRKLAAAPYIRKMREEKEQDEKKLKQTEDRLARANAIIDASKEFEVWRARPVFALEKNDCSRLHMFKSAMRRDMVIVADDQPLSASSDGEKWQANVLNQYTPFVIQHNWAAAFSGAQDFDAGSVAVPYDQCAFEFRISGKTIIVLARPDVSGSTIYFPFVQIGDVWAIAHEPHHIEDGATGNKFFNLALDNIRAALVAMDAEVAVSDVIRAPYKLNAKREREGKEKLFEYRIVSLNKKHRVNGRGIGGGMANKKRLHFRRGHWRHFADFKTWVKWTLVGNPELGFIDKEYRL